MYNRSHQTDRASVSSCHKGPARFSSQAAITQTLATRGLSKGAFQGQMPQRQQVEARPVCRVSTLPEALPRDA